MVLVHKISGFCCVNSHVIWSYRTHSFCRSFSSFRFLYTYNRRIEDCSNGFGHAFTVLLSQIFFSRRFYQFRYMRRNECLVCVSSTSGIYSASYISESQNLWQRNQTHTLFKANRKTTKKKCYDIPHKMIRFSFRIVWNWFRHIRVAVWLRIEARTHARTQRITRCSKKKAIKKIPLNGWETNNPHECVVHIKCLSFRKSLHLHLWFDEITNWLSPVLNFFFHSIVNRKYTNTWSHLKSIRSLRLAVVGCAALASTADSRWELWNGWNGPTGGQNGNKFQCWINGSGTQTHLMDTRMPESWKILNDFWLVSAMQQLYKRPT